MAIGFKRGAVAVGTVAAAAAVNISTGMLTQHWAVAWWAATAVLVLVGGGLQVWLTRGEREPGGQQVSGTIVTGSVRQSIVGTGQQAVTDSAVGGDVSQTQQSEGNGA